MSNPSKPVSGHDLKIDLILLLNNTTLHDVTIICADSARIRACSAFLAARSTVFMQMLFGTGPSSKGPYKEIILKNIRSNALNVVIHYMHTEAIEAQLPPDLIMKVYDAARFFCLPRLMGMALDHVKDIHDVRVASSLLNNCIADMEPDEQNMEVFDVLLAPFYERNLDLGDLNDLSEKALELLLTHTRSNLTKYFKTPEHKLLVCVVDWAWSRSQYVPGDSERHKRLRRLEYIQEPYEEPSQRAKIYFPDEPHSESRAPLLRMVQHIDLVLVCPHRLRLLLGAIDALTDDLSHQRALWHHACAGTRCSSNHMSGLRGKPRLFCFQWDQPEIGTGLEITDGDTVVAPLFHAFRTVRISTPITAASMESCEWDIVIVSTGSQALEMGIIGATFSDFKGMLSASGSSWSFRTNVNEYSHGKGGLHVGRTCINTSYGKYLRGGDVVTFHLNMNDRKCSLSINRQNCGVAWTNLPDTIYPAVCVGYDTKYKVRPRTA